MPGGGAVHQRLYHKFRSWTRDHSAELSEDPSAAILPRRMGHFMSKRTVGGLLVGAGLCIAAAEADAASTIVYQGQRYFCETSCVLHVSPCFTGIVDANGGWTRRNGMNMPTYPPMC